MNRILNRVLVSLFIAWLLCWFGVAVVTEQLAPQATMTAKFILAILAMMSFAGAGLLAAGTAWFLLHCSQEAFGPYLAAFRSRTLVLDRDAGWGPQDAGALRRSITRTALRAAGSAVLAAYLVSVFLSATTACTGYFSTVGAGICLLLAADYCISALARVAVARSLASDQSPTPFERKLV